MMQRPANSKSYSLKELLENPSLLEIPKFDYSNDNQLKKGLNGVVMQTTSQQQALSAYVGPTDLWAGTVPELVLESKEIDEFLAEIGMGNSFNLMEGPVTSDDLLMDSASNFCGGGAASAPMTEFNGVAAMDGIQEAGIHASPPHSCHSGSASPVHPLSSPPAQVMPPTPPAAVLPPRAEGEPKEKKPLVDFNVDPNDLALAVVPGVPEQESFDPKTHCFSTQELRPQPIIKKSKKVFVAEDCKDDKYWARRRKNNVAAKRARDAKRVKENQIGLRAAYLEFENDTLRDRLEAALKEAEQLRQRLSRYEEVATPPASPPVV